MLKNIILKMLFTGPTRDNQRPSSKRRNSALVQKKQSTQLLNIEQNQHDAKAYRSAMHCFIKNLKKYYGKTHKDCLGELEEWYQMPLSRQQQLSVQENLQKIIEKNVQKMSRDVLARNMQIHRGIIAYQQSYSQFKGEPSMQQDKNQQQSLQQKIQNDQITSKKVKENRPNSSCSLTKRAARRSELWVNKNEEATANIRRRNHLNKGVIDLNSEFTGQGEDISCFVFIRENMRKSFRYKDNSGAVSQIKNDEMFHRLRNKGELNRHQQQGQLNFEKMDSVDLLSNDKSKQQFDLSQHRTLNYEKSKRPTTAGYKKEGSSSNSLQRFFESSQQNSFSKNNRRNLEEMEKERIQNKILMINSTLSTNVVSSQGYKPKTKCWGATESTPKKQKTAPQSSKVIKNTYFNKF